MTGVFDHPWLGGLFADAEVASLLSPDAQLAAMIAVEAAHARTLGNEAAATGIEAAQIDPTALREGTAVDGLPVPALVCELKRQIAPELNGAVHVGLTSQDVMDTALVLALRDICALFEARIMALQAALAALTATHGAQGLMGRTRMQAALPITVADRVDAWRLPLADHLERLAQMRPRLLRVQCGGPVGLGRGDALAVMLGLAPAPKAWHAMRDGIGEFAGWLSLVSGTLGKMGQDVALMAQQGVDAVVLSGGGGSSAMPHKQNPVLAELLVTLARFNATQLAGMHHTLVHEQERSGVAWALEWMILPQMLQATGRGLLVAHDITGRIERMGNDA